jgi:hypothetical protein
MAVDLKGAVCLMFDYLSCWFADREKQLVDWLIVGSIAVNLICLTLKNKSLNC